LRQYINVTLITYHYSIVSMRNYYRTVPFLAALIFVISISLTSCSSTKKVKYFQDIPDSGKLKTINVQTYTDPIIRSEDILTVVVETIDPTAAAPISLGNVPLTTNATQSSGPPTYNQQYTSGYLVDHEGNITLPVLGKIKAAGYTTEQLRDIITQLANSKYYKDASVLVRFANFKITLAGEVTRPGVYIFPNERVSILDALTNAGDLTIFGKRENVLLLRENPDGTKTPYRVNLKKSDLMSQPYFYLRQNDYIYVEPRNAKAAANDAEQTRDIAIISGILEVLIILFTRSK